MENNKYIKKNYLEYLNKVKENKQSNKKLFNNSALENIKGNIKIIKNFFFNNNLNNKTPNYNNLSLKDKDKKKQIINSNINIILDFKYGLIDLNKYLKDNKNNITNKELIYIYKEANKLFNTANSDKYLKLISNDKLAKAELSIENNNYNKLIKIINNKIIQNVNNLLINKTKSQNKYKTNKSKTMKKIMKKI